MKSFTLRLRKESLLTIVLFCLSTAGTLVFCEAVLRFVLPSASLRICQERRVECLDLAPLLEKDTTVFYDDVHFNESGARKVAQAVSRYVLEREPFRE